MKKRRGLRIVLIVVAALVVLGVGAFGVRALMFLRGNMPSMTDRLPYGLYEDMPLDGDNLPEGMPYDRVYPRGMMPYSTHRRGGFGTPWGGLLILGLLGLGALHFVHMRHVRRMMYARHMYPGHMPPDYRYYDHHHPDAGPVSASEEAPEVTPTEGE